MRVTISVAGRFHAFDLAKQLQLRGLLERLITSYPQFKASEWSIPRERVKSLLSHELLNRGWSKMPEQLKAKFNPQYFLLDRFDHLAKRYVPIGTDILVGWSGISLHTMRRAKQLRAVTVLERGSTHICFQNEIVREEYESYGIRSRLSHPEIIDKELQEYEEADYISVPSTFVTQSFMNRGIAARKLIQTPYGVDLRSFKSIGKADNVFRVIHCGGLTLPKGVHYLLRAFHELNLKNAQLWLVGSLSDEILPFIRKYGRNVYLRGTFPQAELHTQYSQGSLFCLMSIQEGMAMVIAQAMACGLPVICTPNTGGEDIVSDGVEGYVVPCRNTDVLKEKLQYLYDHQDVCAQMGRAAKRRVESNLTWDIYGERMVQQYRKILGLPLQTESKVETVS